jgi:hypothetical protein
MWTNVTIEHQVIEPHWAGTATQLVVTPRETLVVKPIVAVLVHHISTGFLRKLFHRRTGWHTECPGASPISATACD